MLLILHDEAHLNIVISLSFSHLVRFELVHPSRVVCLVLVILYVLPPVQHVLLGSSALQLLLHILLNLVLWDITVRQAPSITTSIPVQEDLTTRPRMA